MLCPMLNFQSCRNSCGFYRKVERQCVLLVLAGFVEEAREYLYEVKVLLEKLEPRL